MIFALGRGATGELPLFGTIIIEVFFPPFIPSSDASQHALLGSCISTLSEHEPSASISVCSTWDLFLGNCGLLVHILVDLYSLHNMFLGRQRSWRSYALCIDLAMQ